MDSVLKLNREAALCAYYLYNLPVYTLELTRANIAEKYWVVKAGDCFFDSTLDFRSSYDVSIRSRETAPLAKRDRPADFLAPFQGDTIRRLEDCGFSISSRLESSEPTVPNGGVLAFIRATDPEALAAARRAAVRGLKLNVEGDEFLLARFMASSEPGRYIPCVDPLDGEWQVFAIWDAKERRECILKFVFENQRLIAGEEVAAITRKAGEIGIGAELYEWGWVGSGKMMWMLTSVLPGRQLDVRDLASRGIVHCRDEGKNGETYFVYEATERYARLIARIWKKIMLMHDNDICHNDLYELNIILGDEGQIWFIDFALAFWISRGEREVDVVKYARGCGCKTYEGAVSRDYRTCETLRDSGDT